MLKRILFLLLCIGVYTTIHAQSVSNDGVKITPSAEAKIGAGVTLLLSPNPAPKSNPVITVTAVGMDIYSYKVVSATGQIVELENLSGKPDGTIIDLNGAVDIGTYYVIFETNAGKISRKLVII
ncbi:MAG TPA: T9SS type A sorting domain-containing protein [Chitinophagales bacterium]|nr:T9SS type A sorting domain-containing protein [Chitinophagales bacterium]